MNIRKILPIDKNPKISTCIHHAYQCAIIESEELANIQVENLQNYTWTDLTKGTNFEIDNNILTVKADMEANEHDFVIWRDCDENDELCMYIEYMKPMGVGRSIDIFIFDDNLEKEISIQDKSAGFRWNPYGYFLKKEMFSYDTKKYKYLKVQRIKSKLIGYCSADGNNWEQLSTIEVDDLGSIKHCKIGIHAHFGNNYIKKWKQMNFIQLIYNETNEWKGINLDYYAFPRKNIDNGYGYYQPFLDTIYETTYEILDLFDSIHDYIHWNIRHYYYPELCLDEMYVPKRKQYQKSHYYHYSLFYGFDDEKQVYHLMGYDSNNKPVVGEMPYSAFEQPTIITSEKVVRFRFAANDVTDMKFDIDAVKTAANEFLHSVDSSHKLSYLLSQEPLVYGLEVFKVLVSEEPRKKIFYDRRIAFCILEHSKMMRHKIDYYFEQGYIKKEYYISLIEQNEKIVSKASLILNLVIKGLITKSEYPNVLDYLMDMYQLEKGFFTELISALD